ncbi:hypothetical protein EFL69_06505 [Weissella confusa]|uniref:hypothetical protein n=1 Tax=Weissella confusa TaxID=1583 RepID=UPI00223ABD9C|nr:hypothetical protein [Weissella confusa]MCS9992730.1 hypothetical protein [Weissella confusa]
MSFNSKKDYLDPESEAQMKQAFKDNPVRKDKTSALVASLELDTKKGPKERKQSVSITMTPTMKDDLTNIAKEHGYNGLSAFAVDIFEAIIAQNK